MFKIQIFKTIRNLFYEKETAQEFTQIYSQGKGADPPGSFGLERTRKTDSKNIPKNF